jgi:hypothetical protein
MLWIIQENLFCENRRYDLITTLERFKIPHQIIDVENNKTIPEIEYDGAIITNGSVMLSKIAKEKGWQPGSLLNDNFSYEVWFSIFKNYLLNNDAVFTTLGEAKISSPKFIRPLLDNKTINGKVFSPEELENLKNSKNPPKMDTKILISSPKIVGQEHRHYIVDGKVITSSRYKLGGHPNQQEGADDKIIDFVHKMTKIWQPAKAFVLDTYISGDEIGIVELGCICNAGLYQADLQKFVMALEDTFNE